MAEKYRREYKHEINFADYCELRARLKPLTRPDPHADANGRYVIRSLYFDDPYDKALFEKIDGVSMREKFRIRYYNGDTGRIMLEKKSKLSGLCEKRAAKLTREQCQMLISGDTGFMRNSADPLLREFFIKHRQERLSPRAVVSYTREPYIHPLGNVRITFDSDIRAGVDPLDFLDPYAPSLPAAVNTMILEVKYDEYLIDPIRDILQQGRRAGAFSKYAACRVFR